MDPDRRGVLVRPRRPASLRSPRRRHARPRYAAREERDRGRHGILDGHRCATLVEKLDFRAALVAAHRLGVVSTVSGVAVFAGASVAHRESAHGGPGAVVGKLPYYRVARAAVGAVDVIDGESLTTVTAMVNISVAAAAPSSPPSVTVTVTAPDVVTPSRGVHSTRPVDETVMPAGASVRLKVRSVPLLASSGSVTSTW